MASYMGPGGLPLDVETDGEVESYSGARVPILGLPHHHGAQPGRQGKPDEDEDCPDGMIPQTRDPQRFSTFFDSGLSEHSVFGSNRTDSGLENRLSNLHLRSHTDSSVSHHTSDLHSGQSHQGHVPGASDNLLSATRQLSTDEGFGSELVSDSLEFQNPSFSELSPTEAAPHISYVQEPPRTSPNYELYNQDEDGDTQLHIAIIHQNSTAAVEIIKLAPDSDYLNIQNSLKQGPLHLAVLTRQSQVTRKLVARGAKLDSRDRHGNTPLHLACNHGYEDCVQALVQPVSLAEAMECPYPLPNQQMPQNQEIRNYDGDTCLHVAAKASAISVVEILLSPTFGANINAQDGRSGRTILHYAVESNNRELLKCLLRHKEQVRIDQQTFNGYTALQLASFCGHNDLVMNLENAGADKSMIEYQGVAEDTSDEEDMDDTDYDDFTIAGQPISVLK